MTFDERVSVHRVCGGGGLREMRGERGDGRDARGDGGKQTMRAKGLVDTHQKDVKMIALVQVAFWSKVRVPLCGPKILHLDPYRRTGVPPIRNSAPLGPYSRTMPSAL